MKRLISALLLICFVLLLPAGCRSGDGKRDANDETQEPQNVDVFEKTVSLKVEHTVKEGETYYLLALFPDGKTGLWQSIQPGELPELRELDSGKTTKIRLGDYETESIEAIFRNTVILEMKRRIRNITQEQIEQTAEKLESVHGLDIFLNYFNPIVLRTTDYCLTSAESDLMILTDNNTWVGGAFDPNTGTLYNAFRDEGGSFEPHSTMGTKILGRYNTNYVGILDTADLSFRVTELTDTFGYTPKGGDWFYMCYSFAYLADGSMVAIITENLYRDSEILEEDWLCIRRPDGGTEQYMIGDVKNSAGYCIVSNDPNYVIAEPRGIGITYASLINRKTGEVSALKIDGNRIVSVSLEDAKESDRSDFAVQMIDVLIDGRTLIVRDGKTGTLGFFRPDSMETKLIRTDDYAASCMNFIGDHRGRLCATYMSRESGSECGILLTIVDKNGDPIF